MINLTERRMVIPGEIVTDQRKKLGSHVYMLEGKILSDCMGLVEDNGDYVSVIPLKGRYLPKANDIIIGVVVSEKFGGCIVDINSIYNSFLSNDKVREKLKMGSVVSVRITDVSELNEAEIDDVRVLYGGELLHIDAVKVPRVIGKNGSMLEVLKKGTGANIAVGRNGRIWLKGGNIPLVIKSIDKIQREAHTSNLTNKMMEFLSVSPESIGTPQESEFSGRHEHYSNGNNRGYGRHENGNGRNHFRNEIEDF